MNRNATCSHPHPFGMLTPGRSSLADNNYRYAFSGMENEIEIMGSGQAIDFGSRMYDTRIGRWGSVDRHDNRYPAISPYCFVVNSPILLKDIDGNDIYYFDSNSELIAIIRTTTSDDVYIRLSFIDVKPDHTVQVYNSLNNLHDAYTISFQKELLTNESKGLIKNIPTTKGVEIGASFDLVVFTRGSQRNYPHLFGTIYWEFYAGIDVKSLPITIGFSDYYISTKDGTKRPDQDINHGEYDGTGFYTQKGFSIHTFENLCFTLDCSGWEGY